MLHEALERWIPSELVSWAPVKKYVQAGEMEVLLQNKRDAHWTREVILESLV